jgi:hypothetical protein
MIAAATSRSEAVGEVQAGRIQRASEAQFRSADSAEPISLALAEDSGPQQKDSTSVRLWRSCFD